MADAGNALLFILENNGGVAALVSDRVYRDRLPQDPTYPAITIELVTSPPMPDHNAGVTVNFRNIYQINCWGKTTDSASAVRDAVFAATDNQKGTFAGVNVLGLFYRDDRDLHDAEPEVYRRVVEVEMFIET